MTVTYQVDLAKELEPPYAVFTNSEIFMNMTNDTNHFFVSLVSALLLAGCGQAPAPQSTSGAAKVAAADSSGVTKSDGSRQTHDHSGWWCDEHGVPEEECGLCNVKLAAQLQKKGDWCKEHDRPESQCFVCHPELEAQYAAKYEAKFGAKPPKREAE
jgi:cobalt-zinc-cadmium efflux system membrane fusion protein